MKKVFVFQVLALVGQISMEVLKLSQTSMPTIFINLLVRFRYLLALSVCQNPNFIFHFKLNSKVLFIEINHQRVNLQNFKIRVEFQQVSISFSVERIIAPLNKQFLSQPFYVFLTKIDGCMFRAV